MRRRDWSSDVVCRSSDQRREPRGSRSVALPLRHCGPDRRTHLLEVRCDVVDVIRLHSWIASRFHPMLFVLSLQPNDAIGAESLYVLRVGVVLVAPPPHSWLAGRSRELSPLSLAPCPAPSASPASFH